MELSLLKADVQWMAKPLKEKRVLSSTPPVSDLKVVFPSAKKIDDGVPFPCNISIPAEELGTENKTSLLDQHVTFKLMRENELVATHMMKLLQTVNKKKVKLLLKKRSEIRNQKKVAAYQKGKRSVLRKHRPSKKKQQKDAKRQRIYVEAEKKKMLQSGVITRDDIAKMDEEKGDRKDSEEVAAMDVEE
ncbi:hypothetical protein PsorP6_003537 [Peronosclerospora sorghi]|uniref:Uncharacterized protein n=1 Tax=Peronosclerospora sorghi TaxID=230839 RepID=A0ACC0VPI2_9STRA|nr:hypothetical protein PsorP6_003537 [Peronosclerospora sorghi]